MPIPKLTRALRLTILAAAVGLAMIAFSVWRPDVWPVIFTAATIVLVPAALWYVIYAAPGKLVRRSLILGPPIGLQAPESIGAENEARSSLLQAATAFVLGAGLIITLIQVGQTQRATQRQLDIAEQEQTSDRFIRANQSLGDDNVAIRLGGIYGLERVGIDARDYRGSVYRLLLTYVRSHAKPALPPTDPVGAVRLKVTPLGYRQADVQAALAVIAGRGSDWGAASDRLELDRLDLRKVGMAFAKASDAMLEDADLSGASLQSADLRRARLAGCILVDADLRHADLRETSLRRAQLTGARATRDTRWPTGFDPEQAGIVFVTE
jgi:hypothetical protein